ncbi:hypothetical protein HanXRQr2_Chr17g0795071 [Helianthus annuus]|uniref:Uncharacterized protein n=1 Tax=Helianthus annuus TaxID=4232 RepID=A0A9K3DFU4_HELAN|nr:hypothetical protein HanXRQr2_Chr17g0795071 [Helianthus annuus]KAJ0812528.1 hypothetical protein HanPSC8_Chr17g0763001 [Helianthus annuus]
MTGFTGKEVVAMGLAISRTSPLAYVTGLISGLLSGSSVNGGGRPMELSNTLGCDERLMRSKVSKEKEVFDKSICDRVLEVLVEVSLLGMLPSVGSRFDCLSSYRWCIRGPTSTGTRITR